MPSSVQTTYLTYSSANTLISGDASRSGCVWFRAGTGGCNQHFALSVIDASHVTIYGMCGAYDNANINVGQSVLYDGSFHQVCVTYNNVNSQLCIYLDLSPPNCLTRTNVVYNTGSGDVRIW
ncbi:unnamed protein product [Rotaria sp. Silwood2]|nr:unnamed protein product [Rotaria sp. Silwood2]CAF2872007.1 unnamed protein product [Rotaria sp. Silwood2]CAF3135694.1 unnamed protein product [Rotaria sp. Silwood2]CAF3270918.1 unnamed protein product [Rotaria sp. Silwood2]CAF4111274.1 unnamed protein product [Rotaria sp. Silwood2]